MSGVPSNYVAILDVGHGNCCVISDNGETSVIDTGLGTALLEFLTDRGIDKLGVVLLSHADRDHISGLVQLLASRVVAVDRVVLNSDSEKQSKIWRNLAYELEEYESQGRLSLSVQLTADSDDEFKVGEVSCDVVAPGKALAMLGPGSTTQDGRKLSSNSVSAVLRLAKKLQSFLVTLMRWGLMI